jgi:hypothetical protein
MDILVFVSFHRTEEARVTLAGATLNGFVEGALGPGHGEDTLKLRLRVAPTRATGVSLHSAEVLLFVILSNDKPLERSFRAERSEVEESLLS